MSALSASQNSYPSTAYITLSTSSRYFLSCVLYVGVQLVQLPSVCLIAPSCKGNARDFAIDRRHAFLDIYR